MSAAHWLGPLTELASTVGNAMISAFAIIVVLFGTKKSTFSPPENQDKFEVGSV